MAEEKKTSKKDTPKETKARTRKPAAKAAGGAKGKQAAEAKAPAKKETAKTAAGGEGAQKKRASTTAPGEGKRSTTRAKGTQARSREREPAPEKKPAPRRAPREAPERPAAREVPPRPVVRASAKYVRSSARKARLVIDHIRGKSVIDARAVLRHTHRGVARDVEKLLASAVANAENNHDLVGDDLFVKEAHADEGPTLKRFRPRAQGRATRIRKRTSHLTLTLTPRE